MLIAIGLILSLSRAFVIGTVVAFLLESILRRRWKMLVGGALVAAILLVVAGGLLFPDLDFISAAFIFRMQENTAIGVFTTHKFD